METLITGEWGQEKVKHVGWTQVSFPISGKLFNQTKYKKIKQISCQIYSIWHFHGNDSNNCGKSGEKLKAVASAKNEKKIGMRAREVMKTRFLWIWLMSAAVIGSAEK